MKHDSSSHHEAENLAKEAVDQLRQGNQDEAGFVLEEARRLDPDVVEEVIHGAGGEIASKAKPARAH